MTNENSRTWVTGTVDGFPAIVLLQTDGRVRDTVILQNGSDATLAWTDAGTVTAVSGGDVFHIPLG